MYKSIFFVGLVVISSLQASEATSCDEWLETKRSPLENASVRLFNYRSTDIDDPQKIFEGINFETIQINKLAGNARFLLGSAALHGKPNTVAFLLDSKAAIDAQDPDDHTALMHAANHGSHASVVTLLLNRKADPEKSDRYCFTALTMACRKRNKDAIEQLLLHKANTEATYWFGGTPLTLVASQEPYPEKQAIVKLLLEAKANPKHKDSMEKNAQDRAKENGDEVIADLLERYEQKYVENVEKKPDQPPIGPMRETFLKEKKERKQAAAKKIIVKH